MKIFKHKAILVARGFLQKTGIDFDKVYALVAWLETTRIVVSSASYKGWKIHQLDVKLLFINGPLEYRVYVSQPPGFEIKAWQQVYKLRKTLYGLKQALRDWNKSIDTFLIKICFTKCILEHEVYVNNASRRNRVIICLYMDDLLITGTDKA